ncbi:MAG: hypothetical protein GY854_22355 [Deltaproteobacteria bacterium]|nr:hypothetical protein [Deltaproteobacteria bacterium]
MISSIPFFAVHVLWGAIPCLVVGGGFIVGGAVAITSSSRRRKELHRTPASAQKSIRFKGISMTADKRNTLSGLAVRFTF